MEQVVYFVAIWSILQLFVIFYGHLLYFMVICYILWSFVIFYGHLVYFMVIRYTHCMVFKHIFFLFGMLYQEISGNSVSDKQKLTKML
jgi:hypothetical protein